MSVHEIANGLVALCREGKFEEATEKYYSPDIVSIEAMEGEGHEARGIDAIKAKGEWWADNHEIHSITVSDPYPSGDQFAVHFALDATYKPENRRFTLNEIGVYQVADGKIVHEQFFYGMG